MRKPPAQQPLEIGEPEKTPFVRFDGGTVYPSPSLSRITSDSNRATIDGIGNHVERAPLLSFTFGRLCLPDNGDNG